MSFAQILESLPHGRNPLLKKFEKLLQPDANLEAMAHTARSLTQQYFGRTMRLFAPLYLSNECINNCKYCGFSRDNPVLRTTLTPEQVETEARHLHQEGFRNILLVAGEHPKFVSVNYLEECVKRLHATIPSISIEVGPMPTEQYKKIVKAGAEGLVVYQETYHCPTYDKLHTAGPKKNFQWRLDCPERAYEAGFRRIGIGMLIGLWNWREDALALAAHAEYLLKKCWKSFLTISLPRLRPASGGFTPEFAMTDREYAQLISALRICFPRVGLVLSTRESVSLRDGLTKLGITLMSAGSHTEPGGYTRVGEENLHQTVRGKRVNAENFQKNHRAEEQFEVYDDRPTSEVVTHLRKQGFDPVWKDWDNALTA